MGGGGTKGFQGLRGRRKLSLKSRMSRVRPSYNPWARLNHYPPPSQESNERTMDGWKRARPEKSIRRSTEGTEEEKGKEGTRWMAFADRAREQKKRKKKEEKQAHGKKDNCGSGRFTYLLRLARALAGEGWRAKENPTRISVGPSRAVEFSTVIDTSSMHAPASASPPSRRTPGNSQGPVTRWARDVCKQLPSRFHPIWPSTTSIHPSTPLRSWRPAERTYNSRDT